MIAFLAFLIVVAGGVNWLLIGLLQYDFVAGIFGYQGSIFSRLIYILVGLATSYLVFKAFKDKGKINVVNFKFKKKAKEMLATQSTNVESSKDFDKHDKKEASYEKETLNRERFDKRQDEESHHKHNIFDEM